MNENDVSTPEKLLDYTEASLLLKVKKSTLVWWVYCRKIPYLRLGKRTVRFRRSDLEMWLGQAACSVAATDGHGGGAA